MGDRMYLTATDTNMTIESNIPVDSEDDVSFVIEEKNFANIVNKHSWKRKYLWTTIMKRIRLSVADLHLHLIVSQQMNFQDSILEEVRRLSFLKKDIKT